MGSGAQDKSTQTAATAAAQSTDATTAANAAQNQTTANNATTTLFGTYNPTTNQYVGGTESAALDPSSMTTTGLTGSYANLYNNQANTTANAAKNAVSTSLQNQDSRGMGATPAGFSADQQRQAYQTQAATNGTNYATDFGNQHTEAVNAYNTANGLLSSTGTTAANNSLSGTTAAANNYANLYGTASQQKQSPLGAIIGAGATLGAAALSK